MKLLLGRCLITNVVATSALRAGAFGGPGPIAGSGTTRPVGLLWAGLSTLALAVPFDVAYRITTAPSTGLTCVVSFRNLKCSLWFQSDVYRSVRKEPALLVERTLLNP